MWFGHARLAVRERELEVTTDRAFVARWIEGRLAGDLRSAAAEVLGDDATISVLVDAPATPPDAPAHDTSVPAAPEEDVAVPARNGPATRWSLRRLEEFVVGQSNRLAFSAACQLANDDDGAPISPLFLHGECGVGKTHLLQGVCRSFSERTGRPAAVRYVTGEHFTNDYIAAVRGNNLDQFRRRHRKLDLLAIDDVHFLSNKVRTQAEFLHTLDAIGLTGARIVLASDEHPRHIKRFSRALVSRFLSGMVVQIERPDRETRMELVRRLAEARGLHLADAAVQQVAAQCVGSVRELEGAITKLAAMKSLARADDPGRNGTVGMTLVDRLFNERTWRPASPIRIDQVIEAVCQQLGVTRNDLMGTGRHRRVVLARGLVAFLGRDLTTQSYPEIAEALGRRYHSTVHTAAKRLAKQIEVDETVVTGANEPPVALRELVDQLRHVILRSR
ncbi:MAG: DnaA ATPase domain-containing protein [Planctomycetota bacterium]|jgi:chromosomal replication initiator protein